MFDCCSNVAANTLRMEKKFLPARITEWNNRIIIVFHPVNPSTNERERFARTFDINRIQSKKHRKKRAQEIVAELNEHLLPNGYPYKEVKKTNQLASTNAIDALKFAAGCKRSDRESTTDAYIYSSNKFISYLKEKKYDKLKIIEITPRIAIGFLDWVVVEKKLSNVSHNNLASKNKTMFDVLIDREYIHEGSNPFRNYKRLHETEKERRPLTAEEKEILSSYIKEHDKQLYLAVNIMYYCFIRKAEMLRLKFSLIDFKKGIIRMPGTSTKNKKSQIVTIPKTLLKLLIEYNYHKYPGHWLCFGRGFRPHSHLKCSKNTPTSRHRKLVNKLGKLGKLYDINGIHFYSWKDTGVLNMIEKKIDIRKIQNQLRHSSLEETQKYLKKIYDVIEDIREIEDDI